MRVMTEIRCGWDFATRDPDGKLFTVTGFEPSDVRDYAFADSQILNAFKPIVGAGSISWIDHIDKVRTQQAATCIGYLVATTTFLAASIAGHPIAFPSPLYIYTRARLLGDPPKMPNEPLLTDWGCGARFAMKAIRDTGLVAEDRWPEIPENINAIPPADVWQEGECATVQSFYLIESDENASPQIVEALRRGYCPGVCMTVDEKYVDLGEGTYDSPGGKVLGGHGQVIVAWDEPGRRFGLLNSWGPDVGDGGIFWVTERFMNTSTNGKWVVQHAPAEVR